MTDKPPSDETEQRLNALESRLSHHERMADEMSEVVARQAQEIKVLTAQLRRLRERLDEVEWSPSPRDEKPPPHY